MNKRFKELDLSNAFLFAAALSDPDTCRLVLEIILGTKLSTITVHHEDTVLLSSDFRSVRFDIYAKDELEVSYNVEAQNANERNLPKRSRFHQAELDVASLKPGEHFEDLKPVYVIFICTFDPFGQGLYRYTFENRCEENGMSLEDGAKRIFLNTKGKNESDVPKELVHFLRYMQHSTDEYVEEVKDVNISKLHSKVKDLKRLRGLEEKFMTGEEMLIARERLGREEGHSVGLTEGLAEGLRLSINYLISKFGDGTEEIESRILSENNPETLKRWMKIAAEASSAEEFVERTK